MKMYRIVQKKYFDSEETMKINDKVVVIFNDPEREYYDDAGVRTLDGKYLGAISHGSHEDYCSSLRNLHLATITEITERTYTIAMNLGETINVHYYPKIHTLEIFKKSYAILQKCFPKAVMLFQLQDEKEPDNFRFSSMLHVIEQIDEFYSLRYLHNGYERSLHLIRVYFSIPTYLYLKSHRPDWYKNGFEDCLGGIGNPRYQAHKKFIEEYGDYDLTIEIDEDDLLTFQ